MSQNLVKNRRFTSQTFKFPAIPWVSTPLYFDVFLYFVSIPIFWLLGLDQFVPPVILGMMALKYTLLRPKAYIPLAVKLAALFLLVQWVSALFIAAPWKFLTFIKNFATYVSAFLMLGLVINLATDLRVFRLYLWAITILGWAAVTIGTLFLIGVMPPRFTSPIAHLLPESIKSLSYIKSDILLREVGRPNAVLMGWRYPRISSIIYPHKYGTTLLILMPVQWLLFTHSKGWKRYLLALFLPLSFVNFVLTGTRFSFVGFVVGLGAYLLVKTGLYRRIAYRPLSYALVALAVLLSSVLGLLIQGDGVLERLGDELEQVFVEGRAGSYTSRMQIYKVTFQSWMERPLFGWGTQRDLPNLLPQNVAPAGTHSNYIGILYRHGLVGLAVYIALLLAVWRRIFEGLGEETDNRLLKQFIELSVFAMLAVNVDEVARGLEWDATVLLLVWGYWGLIVAAHRLLRKGTEARYVPA